MTIYETIKAAISVKQAAEHYGLKVNRNGIIVLLIHFVEPNYNRLILPLIVQQ